MCIRDSPYTVAAGNPAKEKKRRFSDSLINLLLQWKWWDLEPEKLVEVLPLLCDPDLERIEKSLKKQLENEA